MHKSAVHKMLYVGGRRVENRVLLCSNNDDQVKFTAANEHRETLQLEFKAKDCFE